MKPRRDALRERIAELEIRLQEAEETLLAIRQGEVDALVVTGAGGDQIFTLQGAETPYRFLIEEMNEGALLLAPDGTILYANTRFANLVERPLEQVIGSGWLLFFHVTEQKRASQLLRTPNPGGVKAEFQLLGRNEAPRPVEVSLAPMKRERMDGFSVVVTDLTERKGAEEALHNSNAKLKELVFDLEQFSYSISHDMRAPLRAMRSFAELLEKQSSEGERLKNPEWLSRISAAATRLDALIQGALDYARVVRGEMSTEPVDLATLLAELMQTYPNLAPERADIRIKGTLPEVIGNAAALNQVFSNLLENAVKFVPRGRHPRVRIWAHSDFGPKAHANGGGHDLVRITITDNGIGIPLTAQTRIFDMFERASKDYEGTGIGLTVVRKLVERMGGRVGVDSEEGKGSRFWVELHSPKS